MAPGPAGVLLQSRTAWRLRTNVFPLSSLLVRLLAGASLKAAVEQLNLSFALETVYRLRRVLRQRLESIRTLLCREQKPPASSYADPLLQTVEHLQSIFPRSQCALSAFQFHFQRPFLG